MRAMAISRRVERLLSLIALEWLARLALASPFLVSGVVKLFDFAGAAEEVAGLGLRPGAPFAVVVILAQLGGSALFLTRRFCWLGAGILAGFTVIATVLAHPFWVFDGSERGRKTATFFEYVGIVGGFVMAAMLVNGRRGSP